jgi:hypothetical protein
MSSRAEFRARRIGSAALAALRAPGPAKVFAAFERSCYVETPSGIACLGGPGLGLGPLNAIVEDFESFSVGISVFIEIKNARLWRPCAPSAAGNVPEIQIPESIEKPARSFLAWLRNEGPSPDGLIGLGPGLTPAGDDFVGGAMVALRAFGEHARADRIAGWALPLAEKNTGKISRAHLRCAAAGEGHEALHELLRVLHQGPRAVDRALASLARVGHSSGRDAAAGALLALG